MREEHVPLSAGVAALEQELRRLELCEEICPMAPMAPRTTLRIGGAADLLVTPRSASAVAEIVALAREGGVPFLILGNGSNLLVSDLGVEGLVISLRETLCKTQREGNRLTAGAGLLLSAAAAFARDERLSGLEFAAGIPGTVGGGVYMNCGAYGSEMKDVVESSLVLGSDGEISILKARQHGFSYRHSSLMENGDIVLATTFLLSPARSEEISARMEELMARRREKQPLSLPSAGSTFKRPQGGFAAQMIDEAGLKGRRVGGAMVSEKHAGFLVNAGGATAADMLALMLLVQQTVQQRTGVTLEPEVRFVGREMENSHVLYK